MLALVQAIHTPGAEDCNFTFHCIGAGAAADWTGTLQDHHDNQRGARQGATGGNILLFRRGF